ncbi:hypothetical protein Bca4012_066780 [Brassica carinata]
MKIARSIGRSHNLFNQEENTSLKLLLGKECVEDQLVEGLKLIVPRSFVLMSDIGSLQSNGILFISLCRPHMMSSSIAKTKMLWSAVVVMMVEFEDGNGFNFLIIQRTMSIQSLN